MAVGSEMGSFPGAIFKSFTIKTVVSKALHFRAVAADLASTFQSACRGNSFFFYFFMSRLLLLCHCVLLCCSLPLILQLHGFKVVHIHFEKLQLSVLRAQQV